MSSKKRSGRPAPKRAGARDAAAASPGRGASRERGATGVVRARGPLELATRLVFLAAVLLPPLVFDSPSRDTFRLPKALLFGTLALASLLLVSLRPIDGERARRFLRAPALLAVGPLVAVATLLAPLSAHPEHVHRGLVALWIGALTLWGWSVAFPRPELESALGWLLAPASLLAFVGILQFHDIFQPFEFANLVEASRLAITSFAGNAGDLGAFLVLPALVAQWRIVTGRRPALSTAALALSFYGLALTQTFAAAAALAAGTLLFWIFVLPPRRRAAALGSAVAVAAIALLAVAPFRDRAAGKARQLARGDWNELLTGRLDGWRTGIWMFEQHPATGVGIGAYRTEFLPAREALVDRGVKFFEKQVNVVFANAHNEAIEVAAELGLPGLLALGWALWRIFVACAAKRGRPDATGATAHEDRARQGFAWGGVAALLVLSLVHFPFRIALVAGPAILFLAWLLAPAGGTASLPSVPPIPPTPKAEA